MGLVTATSTSKLPPNMTVPKKDILTTLMNTAKIPPATTPMPPSDKVTPAISDVLGVIGKIQGIVSAAKDEIDESEENMMEDIKPKRTPSQTTAHSDSVGTTEKDPFDELFDVNARVKPTKQTKPDETTVGSSKRDQDPFDNIFGIDLKPKSGLLTNSKQGENLPTSSDSKLVKPIQSKNKPKVTNKPRTTIKTKVTSNAKRTKPKN